MENPYDKKKVKIDFLIKIKTLMKMKLLWMQALKAVTEVEVVRGYSWCMD